MWMLLLALAAAAAGYETDLADLATRRAALAARWEGADAAQREVVLGEAREVLLEAISGSIFPAWAGTPWDFYGTTETPGQGEIACGYYVTTVLRDAGFRVERVRLAQQASEHIIRTVVPADRIRRFRDRGVDAVVADVEAQGPGLYLVGLDWHVGFLLHDGEQVRMCHASYLGTAEVLCEDARRSPAMVSRYHVTGRLLEDRMVVAWLEERPLPTVGTHVDSR